jgi:hypothetical protein
VVLDAKPTFEQIGTQKPASRAAQRPSYVSQRATALAVCSFARFARSGGTPYAPHSFDLGIE